MVDNDSLTLIKFTLILLYLYIAFT